MKRMTRRQAIHWLQPIRRAMSEIRTGEVDAIQGYAVTRLHERDDYARLDFCINGFVGLIARLFPDFDTTPAQRLSKRLAAGVPLTVTEVDTVCGMLKRVEDKLCGMPIATVKAAVMVEQIAIELDSSGLREAA